MSKLRIGLIGAGRIAREAHIPAWSAYTDEADIEIVADIDGNKAEQMANEFNIPNWTAGIENVLQDPGLDAVDICLPAPLHRQVIVAALEQGKHVLTEKPFVQNVPDALEALRAQQASGKVLMIAQNWIYSSGVREAESLIKEGVIGDIIMFHSRYESPLYLGLTTEVAMRERLRYTGGGFTMAAGVHALNLGLYFVGNVKEVTAYTGPTSFRGNTWMDRSAAVAVKFESGAIGSFSFTGESRKVGPRVMEVSIHGTHGNIELDVEKGQVQWSNGNHSRILKPELSLGFKEEVGHFIKCIKEGLEPITSGRNQVATVQLVSCIYSAFETGELVTLSSVSELNTEQIGY